MKIPAKDNPDAGVPRWGRRDTLVLLALAVPILLFFADPVFTGRVFHHRDFSRFFYPNYHYAAERLREGQLPLWDPYCFCGHPFMASWYPAALYPLSAIYVLLPFDRALTAFVVLHAYLAPALMYVLLRDLHCRRPAAALGALAFGLSGFALSTIDNPNTLTSLVWMPLVFMLVRRVIGRPSAGLVAGTAVVIALQVYAGGPEMVYCTWLLVGLYAASKVLNDLGTAAGRRVFFPRLGAVAACFVLGLLLAALQLVPFAEVFANSTRGKGYGIGKASFWDVPLRDLLRFIVPDYMTNRTPFGVPISGQQWLKSFYLGLAPLMLTGIALVRVRGRRTLLLVGVGVLGTLLACGDRTLFWVGAYYVMPGIAGLRYPVKFMALPTFSVAVLAAFGTNWLLCAARRERRRTLVVACAVVLIVLAGVGAEALRISSARAALLDDTGRPAMKPDKPRVEAYGITLRSLARTAAVLGAMAVCLAWLAAGTRAGGHGRRLILPAAALGLVLVADTVHHHLPQKFTAHPKIYRLRAASLDRIEALPRPSRVFTDPALYDWARGRYISDRGDSDPLLILRELHTHNLPLVSHVQKVYGFVPIRPYRFETLYMALRQRAAPYRMPILDFLNCRMVMYAPLMIGEAHLDPVRFEARPTALPRATIRRTVLREVPAPEPADTQPAEPRRADLTRDEAAAQWMTSRWFDPAGGVYFDEDPPRLPTADGSQSAARDQVTITTYEPERVVMQVESTAPGYLVVADQFYPGWRATVNGKRTEIGRANLCFRAVPVPAGAFTVEMTYRPWTVTAGLVGLVVGMAVVAGLLICGRLRRRGRAGSEDR